jgi:hypothetical protein
MFSGIWGSHGGEYEGSYLLGCSALYTSLHGGAL